MHRLWRFLYFSFDATRRFNDNGHCIYSRFSLLACGDVCDTVDIFAAARGLHVHVDMLFGGSRSLPWWTCIGYARRCARFAAYAVWGSVSVQNVHRPSANYGNDVQSLNPLVTEMDPIDESELIIRNEPVRTAEGAVEKLVIAFQLRLESDGCQITDPQWGPFHGMATVCAKSEIHAIGARS